MTIHDLEEVEEMHSWNYAELLERVWVGLFGRWNDTKQVLRGLNGNNLELQRRLHAPEASNGRECLKLLQPRTSARGGGLTVLSKRKENEPFFPSIPSREPVQLCAKKFYSSTRPLQRIQRKNPRTTKNRRSPRIVACMRQATDLLYEAK